MLYLELAAMADEDGFLEAFPASNEANIRLASEGSSDEEYERMTAADVLEKLEEVSVTPYLTFDTFTFVTLFFAGLDKREVCTWSSWAQNWDCGVHIAADQRNGECE